MISGEVIFPLQMTFNQALGKRAANKALGKRAANKNGLVKRRSTTTAKVNVPNFNEVRWQFLVNIKTVAGMEEIPFSIIINWDQTAIKYIRISR